MQVGTSMTEMVGCTPVVQLDKVMPRTAADVLVKLEWFNPTGSYKDRMALAMIEQAERRGGLRPGMTVLEYTAGGTGSSLAYVCAAKGYRFRVVTSDAFAPEKLATMQALDDEGSDARLVIFEPDTSPVITTGRAGNNRVEGIGIGFVPPMLVEAGYDEARAVSEAKAFEMARRLAGEEGLLAGASTGLNVVGAIEIACELGPGHTVVTIACDTGLKYLAAGLFER